MATNNMDVSGGEEDIAPPSEHPEVGGKTLAAVGRPRYKSWRKKYRKMRHKFDGVLDENKRYYMEEQKLEGIARRLQEEVDAILDMCLSLNQQPGLPTNLRFNIDRPGEERTTTAIIQKHIPETDVPTNITPQIANEVVTNYKTAVTQGRMPHVDLYIVRGRVESLLSTPGTLTLESLEQNISHPIITSPDQLPEDIRSAEPAGYFTSEHEEIHLLRLDAKLGDRTSIDRVRKRDEAAVGFEDRHWIDLRGREVDRLNEIQNPQSQHNWLKTHAKNTGDIVVDLDDNESVTGHEKKSARSSGHTGNSKRNLAKQLADKVVDRARGDASPNTAASPGYGYGDDDEHSYLEEAPPSTTKKRARKDEDGAYRSKAKVSTGGGSTKGKRKRSGEDIAVAKKAKLESID